MMDLQAPGRIPSASLFSSRLDEDPMLLRGDPGSSPDAFFRECIEHGVDFDDFDPSVFRELARLTQEERGWIAFRFFSLLPRRHQGLFLAQILDGYRKQKFQYEFHLGDWNCSACGLIHPSTRAACTWKGCQGQRHSSRLLTPNFSQKIDLKPQRVTICTHYFEKGCCFFGTNCTFSHRDVRKPTGVQHGFHDLAPDLQAQLYASFANYSKRVDDIAPRVYDSITDFPYTIQLEIVSQFCNENLRRVKNLSGYFVGIIKKFRKQITEEQKRPRSPKGNNKPWQPQSPTAMSTSTRSPSPPLPERLLFSNWEPTVPHAKTNSSSASTRSLTPRPLPEDLLFSTWEFTDVWSRIYPPQSLDQLRLAWDECLLDGRCWARNGSMTEWREIETLPALWAYLNSRPATPFSTGINILPL